jgi:phage-related protein
MADEFKVEFYETSDGKCPFLDFLSTLDVKLRAKVFRDLGLLQKNGNDLGMPFSKFLDDGIFELRTKLGSNNVRVLYFFIYGKTIIITNGFKKKTQKTPIGEIQLAQKYRNEYVLRNKNIQGGKN